MRAVWRRPPERPSDSDEEVEAQGGGDVQHLQAEGRRSVGEEDGEGVFGVHQQLKGVASVLETVLKHRKSTGS